MSKMSWISYLCETGNRKALVEEVGSVEIANEFLDAHIIMRNNKENPAYQKLNEIHDEMQKDVNTEIGEICEHGNSWLSNCSDCDNL